MATKLTPSETSEISQWKTGKRERDFLRHVESYLEKREGIDKLLKIARYVAKIGLASSLMNTPLGLRLQSFESSINVSRKAFRLGKFVQYVNALRAMKFDSVEDSVLSVLSFTGDGLYYFIEQYVWIVKTGLIDGKYLSRLHRISIWAELIGYIGRMSLKFRDLKKLIDEASRMRSKTDMFISEEIDQLKDKLFFKKLSIIQELADGFLIVIDICNVKGFLSNPLVLSSSGLLSALISTYKHWTSC